MAACDSRTAAPAAATTSVVCVSVTGVSKGRCAAATCDKATAISSTTCCRSLHAPALTQLQPFSGGTPPFITPAACAWRSAVVMAATVHVDLKLVQNSMVVVNVHIIGNRNKSLS